MIVSYEAETSEIPYMLHELFRMVHWEKWKKRVDNLKLEGSQSPAWADFLEESHGIEMSLVKTWDYYRTTRRVPWPPADYNQYKLYAFMALVTRVYKQLPDLAQKKLIGLLEWGLQQPHGLDPLYAEVSTAGQLMSKGIDVDFNDLTREGFDFLCSFKGVKFEVECKRISKDKGRKIHERDFRFFIAKLDPVLKKSKPPEHKGAHIIVTIPDRLSRDNAQHQDLIRCISSAMSEQKTISDHTCDVSYSEFDIATSIFSADKKSQLTQDDIRKAYEDDKDIGTNHIFCTWKPGNQVTIIAFKSKKEDTFLDSIFKDLNDQAQRQLTKELPGILIVHFGGISNDQLQSIADTGSPDKPTGLLIKANELLEKRPHLHSVAFASKGQLAQEKVVADGKFVNSVRERSKVYVFDNPSYPTELGKTIRYMYGV